MPVTMPGMATMAVRAKSRSLITQSSAVLRHVGRVGQHTNSTPSFSWRYDGHFKTPARGSVARRQSGRSEADQPRDIERDEAKRRMEDELKDPRTPFEYLLPRPLRLAILGSGAASCFIACLLGIARIASDPSLSQADGSFSSLGINVAGLALFATLFSKDNASAEKRVERRKEIRQAQIEFGDREVFVNESGQRMSKLKEVDDDWILRRLERWGQRDQLPLVGPKKGALLQDLIREKQPQRVVEIGSFLGYSAILIAQALPDSGRLVTIENDLKFVLSTKRFLWQASQGEVNKTRSEPLGRKVRVKWGRAQQVLPSMEPGIDFVFIDGRPKEYLEYLKAVEGNLALGATIVADNAGVFAEGGLKSYLEYVRTSPLYKSTFVESTLEWRDDVPDGLEVSEYLGDVPQAAASGAATTGSQASEQP